jgi:chemotaxis family two-component system response regulator Rcp1
MEILLIDDNSGDIMMFRKALKTAGSESKLTVFEDGNKAMDYLVITGNELNAIRPDLIVLDLNLPGKHGLQLLKYLKTNEKLKRIPVIVLTDSDSTNDIADAYNLFANCFIIKPRDSDVFMKYVEYIDNFWSTTVSIATDVFNLI